MASATWTTDTLSNNGGLAERTLARLLRTRQVSLASASRRIERGLPYRLFTELCGRLRLTQAELARLLRISESTLYRRRAAGRFESTESDRLWRYLVLYARAVEVHEEPAAAVEWLHAPASALAGAKPLDVARDGPGLQRALGILGRIEQGVFG